MNRKRQQNDPEPMEQEPEPEETPPELEPQEPEPLPTKSEPASSPDPISSQILAETERAQKLMTQNFQLVVSRVQQMADSLAEALKNMQAGLEVMKTTADLQQEFLAGLNEQTERLVTVSAALLRYSQEQAAMIASGGGQDQQQ